MGRSGVFEGRTQAERWPWGIPGGEEVTEGGED